MKNAERYFTETSLVTKWLYVRQKVLRQVVPYIPRQIYIGVTHRCQCQCVHCCLGPLLNKDRNELGSPEIRELIIAAKKLGVLEVSYFGGEPTLREDITDLIRFSHSQGLLTGIYTNGILLTRERVRSFKEAGLVFCNVSLDSASPERHDALRVYKGCFEKAVEGIELLMESGVKCAIWTYVKKSDAERGFTDLKAIIALGRRLKVARVVVLFPMASGNWLCGAENILTDEEKEKVRAFHNPPFVFLEFPSEDAACTAGKRMVYVTPQGDVSPCPTIPHFFGNVRKESLKAILKKLNTDFVASKIGGCGDCVMNHEHFRESIGVESSADSPQASCKSMNLQPGKAERT